MNKINLVRVVLGGLVAGVIINVFEFLLNGVLLADTWPVVMKSINRPALGVTEIVYFNIFAFVQGLAAVMDLCRDPAALRHRARHRGVGGAAHLGHHLCPRRRDADDHGRDAAVDGLPAGRCRADRDRRGHDRRRLFYKFYKE